MNATTYEHEHDARSEAYSRARNTGHKHAVYLVGRREYLVDRPENVPESIRDSALIWET